MLNGAPYVTHAEIFGGTVTEGDLAELVGELSLDDCLQTLGKLMAVLDTRPEEASGWLYRALPRPAKRRLKRDYLGSAWIFPERLAAAMRVALTHADRRPAESLGATEARQLAEVILGVVDVFDAPSAHLLAGDPSRFLISMQLQQISAARKPQLVGTIARAQRLFVELPEELAGRHREVELADLPTRARRQLGMSLERYLAISAAIALPVFGWDDDPSNWGFASGFLRETRIGEDEVAQVLPDLSATPDQLASSLERELAEGHSGLWYLETFFRYPFCEVTPGRHVALYPRLIIERLLGDGLYWRLSALFPGEADLFGAAVGRLLETHIREVASSVYPDAEDSRLFGEVPYGGGKLGPDLALYESGALAMVEVGARRVHFRRTLLGGDVDSFEQDLDIVLERAEQLSRKIDALRMGELDYRDTRIEATRVQVWPVAVLHAGFPQGPVISERLEQAVAASGHLRQRNVAPLTVLSAEDFEAAMWVVESGRSSFIDLLGARLKDQMGRREPLTDFIWRTLGTVEMPRQVLKTYEAAAALWTSELGFRPPPALPTS